MDVSGYAIEVITISSSGVISPGPLFFTTAVLGIKLGFKSGLRIAAGHATVEIPLVLLIALGMFTVQLTNTAVRAIGILGGSAILAVAFWQFYALRTKNVSKVRGSLPESRWVKIDALLVKRHRSPYFAGLFMSAMNPFFILWWISVGAKLVTDSRIFGQALGVSLLLSFHLWMDFAWLGLVAYLTSRGMTVLTSRYYRILIIILNAALGAFGAYFIISSI